MVGVTKIQRGNAGYWINAVAEGAEDYYTKPGEAPAEWIGGLGAELGLRGSVDRDEYAAALAGRHPKEDKVLVARPKPRTYTDPAGRKVESEPVLGYDMRFAAPKSVSLLYAVGSPRVRETVVEAHDRAVREAFGYLERNACFVARDHAGKRIEPGAGLMGMAFRHRMSRAGDPALHTHVVVPNTTRAVSDGRWLSLASPQGRSAFWQHAKASGYVYQAALRAEVTRELGLEWGEVRNGHADLAEIGRPVIEHFSQRRMEILAALAEHGVDSPAAAEVAAYRTREAKDHGADVDERRAEWISRAAEFELGAAEIDAMLERAQAREPEPLGAEGVEVALEGLEAGRSHFDRREAICALAGEAAEGASAAELEGAADRLLAGENAVLIHRGADGLAPTYYTTPRTWEAERRFMEIAREGREAGAATLDPTAVEAALERHSYLGGDQREMVRRLLEGGERIVPVAALPGTGKTTALGAAREAWEAAGHPVIGVATARSAAGELADAGVPSTSITALLILTDERRSLGEEPLAPGTVILMDESSTTSTRDAVCLAQLIEDCGGKLVAIGDPRQIGAVGPGGLYGHLTLNVEPSLLTEIRRQRAEVDREIVRLAHAGRGSDALDLLRAEQRLAIADTHEQALDALALDWLSSYQEGKDSVMIARRNRDVAELNERARALLDAEGAREEGIEVAETEFCVGDRVITRVNTPHVSNRERWEVIAVSERRREIELRRIDGDEREVTLRSRYLDEFRTPHGEPSLQHAYALSAFAAESKTFEEAFAFLDASASREEFLVSVSRSRGPTTAYGVAALELTDAELGPGLRRLEDAAHEIRAAAERQGEELPALEVSKRQCIAAMEEWELARWGEQLRRREHAQTEQPTPAAERLASLERWIEQTEGQLETLRDRYRHESAKEAPDAAILEDLRAAGTDMAKRLKGLRAERRELDIAVSADERSEPLCAEERLEMQLIEERLRQLCRRGVALERLDTSPMVLEALGERPADPDRAAVWNEGVEAIYSYRQRHAIETHEDGPLGRKPQEPRERAEWADTAERVERIRDELASDRSVEHTVEAELDVGL